MQGEPAGCWVSPGFCQELASGAVRFGSQEIPHLEWTLVLRAPTEWGCVLGFGAVFMG